MNRTALVSLLAGIIFHSIALAQTLVVNNPGDSGPGSLRQFLAVAPSGSIINFSPSLSGQTIFLTSGPLLLNSNVTIDASALPAGIQISGADQSSKSVFEVHNGVTAALKALTIEGGSGTSGNGGAIFNQGTAILLQCTLAHNSAAQGGAIYNQGTCAMTNCTLALNFASSQGGAAFSPGTLSLTHCTVAGNTATNSGQGGGVYSAGPFTLLNTIVVANNGDGDVYSSGALYANGSNLVQTFVNTGGTFTGAPFSTNAPLLSPLGNYGGPTPTMPPLPASPAIDAAVSTPLTVDQRGFPRPVGPAPDLGAVEFQANPVVVANDSGPGSLRYAVEYCAPGTQITFSNNLSGQTIYLITGQITVSNNLTIDASALPAGIQINPSGLSPAFVVSNGVSATFKLLTLTNGSAGSGYGGGMVNEGSTTLSQCTLAGNSAFGGGAILNAAGSLSLSQCALTGNAADSGGAIMSFGACAMTNCTLALNTATLGGAVYMQDSALTLVHCTVASNASGSPANGGSGGGVLNGSGGTLTLLNSIIAGNTGAGDIYSQGSVSAVGSNLVQVFVSGGGTFQGAPFITSPPLLSPLGNYGGPTLTMPPTPPSPAIDAAVSTTLTVDQRGLPRPAGPAPDLGAVEFQASPVVVANDSGPGSLRYAVEYCTSGTQITFAANLSGQTISLTSGELLVNNNLTIDASALPAGIHISGSGLSRVFEVAEGASATFKSLAIINGAVNNATGGGVFVEGTAAFSQCTLADNAVSGDDGGAIYNLEGTLLMSACTLYDNTALYGGAIANSGTSSLVNCTLTGNVATDGGGAIANLYEDLELLQCTISANSGQGGGSLKGGGLLNSQGTIFMTNTIVANNNGDDINNTSTSTFNFGGTNLVQVIQNTGTTNGPGSILSAAPLLASLGNHGGPTLTMPPLAGSPAIDAGNSADASGLATDQRGYPRISGARVDIGAVEVQIAQTPPLLTGPKWFTSGPAGPSQFDFNFTNLIGGSFTVFAATNLDLPLNTWSNIGPASEVPVGSGQFQFSDPQATNYAHRYYRVRSP